MDPKRQPQGLLEALGSVASPVLDASERPWLETSSLNAANLDRMRAMSSPVIEWKPGRHSCIHHGPQCLGGSAA